MTRPRLLSIRSERRLCEEVHLNLAYRWFCRLGLGGDVPDHSTFSKNRHGRFREVRRGRMKRWLRRDPETVRSKSGFRKCSQATTATFLKARTGLFEPKSPVRGNGIFRAETKRPKRL
jgi:hypothetical protein